MIEHVKNVYEQVNKIAIMLKSSRFPKRYEPAIEDLTITNFKKYLANTYLAIVAICHQTSPIGERQFEGYISTNYRKGWDYLKEKFLFAVTLDPKWSDPEFWQYLTPTMLSELYEDKDKGCTLSRVNERTFFLNNLGEGLIHDGFFRIDDVITSLDYIVSGDNGFIKYLSRYEAYSDPLNKKTNYFLSLAETECGWKYKDPENIRSPIDYHELRGHLRLGTINVVDERIKFKLINHLPVSIEDDLIIRKAVQDANEYISREVGVSASELHYFLWNIFRSCCSRRVDQTHCLDCTDQCTLPEPYKTLPYYQSRCIFNEICPSKNNQDKLIEPPYIGHYY
jgi:hypothetical protein